MTPQEIIADALIPGTHSVLVLGTFESRVTVYAQQVRALNLVDALIVEGLVRDRGRVAIVGGGAAGATAAVALAKAKPQLAAIDLFERRSNILELQHNSSRYLHPHFYDWPALGSEDPNAGLPIMNWHAGSAGSVAEALRQQFDVTTHSSILTFHAGEEVTELNPSPLGSVRVVVPSTSAIKKIYDVVILAIGFGLEAYLDGDTPSYWTPTPLSGPIHTQLPNPVVFVSGNGDGGLVDFMMAAFNALEHRAICELLIGLDLGPALEELKAIEQEAWLDGADVDLLAAYRARLRHLIPANTWIEIQQRLRPNALIKLHTNEPRLFRRTTALHNRLGAFLVIEADADLGRNAISVHAGVDFEGGMVPVRNEVRLVGQPPFSPFRRFLRLGADKETNLAPFAKLLQHYPGATRAPTSATRPSSPVMTVSARTRFAPFAEPPPAAPPPEPVARIENSDEVVLTLNREAEVVWAGDLTPNRIDQVWSANRGISIHIELSAADATALMPVIARIGMHAQSFIIYTHDVRGWRAGMDALCARRELPGPDVPVHCSVEEWRAPSKAGGGARIPLDTLVSNIQARLDAELLKQLRDALYECLGPPAVETGWPIEPMLRETLWGLWKVWYALLTADPIACRRFLRLLAHADDRAASADSDLVCVGPRIIRPFLTKPAVFGLAFAACSGHALVPSNSYPGNMAHEALTGHACGVGWLNGRELGSRGVSEQAWTTGVVLLSQLREAFQIVESDTRFDRQSSDEPMVGTISPGEEPLIIGADEVFLGALEAGEQPVREYLQSIFRGRSELLRRTLEDTQNAND